VRVLALVGAGAAAVVLAACSTATSGSGHASAGRTVASASSTSPETSGPPSSSSPSSSSPTTSPSATPTTFPVPTTPVRTATVKGYQTGATYVIKVWVEKDGDPCVGHTYGAQVTAFVAAHQCRGLSRILASTVVNGRPVGFAQESTSFTGTPDDPYSVSGAFKQLVTQDGTGSLNDLLREGYRFPGGPSAVPSPDSFGCEGQDAGVTITDAWYLTGSTPDNDPALVTMASEIYLQF
jgi:hypothetical protein